MNIQDTLYEIMATTIYVLNVRITINTGMLKLAIIVTLSNHNK